METISIKIDVSKIDKSKIISRTFKNKAGENVTVKELALDIVPLKETKLLKDAETYQLYKTHFVAVQRTKEEKAAKMNSKIIGEGTIFKNKETKSDAKVEFPEAEINSDDIPF